MSKNRKVKQKKPQPMDEGPVEPFPKSWTAKKPARKRKGKKHHGRPGHED